MAGILREFVWRPTLINGCRLWLDAADASTVTESGGFVTNVLNKQTNAIVLSNASGFTYNKSTRSFFNSTQSSSANLGRNSTHTQNQPGTFFAVATFSSVVSNPYLIDSRSTNVLVGRFAYSVIRNAANTADVAYAFAGNGSAPDYGLRTAENISSNTPIMHTLVMNDTNSDVRINGITQTFTQSPGTNNMTGITVANRYSDDQSWVGSINEILLYNRGLSLNERQQVEGYLAWKWGLQTSLPSAHPFRFNRVYSEPRNTRLVPYIQPSPVLRPSTVGNCRLWLDAADTATLALAGTSVIQWNDKSGNNNHATQVTAGNRPVYNSSTRTLSFTRTSAHFMNLPNSTLPVGNNSYAYFILCSFASFADGLGIIGGGGYGTTGAVFALRSLNTDGRIHQYWWGIDVTTGAGVYSVNTPLLVEATYTSGGVRATLTNGVVRASDSPSSRSQTSANNTIGTTYSTEYHNGTISEIMVFDGSLTVPQREQVEGYFAWKYGLTLPATHSNTRRPIASFSFLPRQIVFKPKS